jgi:hypothetical protein
MDENALQLLSTLSRSLSIAGNSQVTVVIVQINNQQPTIHQTRLLEGQWEALQVIDAAPQAEHDRNVIDDESFLHGAQQTAPVFYNEDEVIDVDSEPAEPTRAQSEISSETLRAALDRRKASATPPSILASRYKSFEVVGFDGERLKVTPSHTRSLDGSLTTPEQLEQIEAPLRSLAKTILSETDLRAEVLFRRVLGCSVKEASGVSLEFLSRVFLGRGSPAEISDVLALVDWSQRASFPSRAAREAALAEYYQTHLGLSTDGFALNYFRIIHGASADRVTLRTQRLTTDELMVGDFVRWSGGRTAIVEKVFNLLSNSTRIEVIELGTNGLTKAAYKLQQPNQDGSYLTSTSETTTGEVKIFSPF